MGHLRPVVEAQLRHREPGLPDPQRRAGHRGLPHRQAGQATTALGDRHDGRRPARRRQPAADRRSRRPGPQAGTRTAVLAAERPGAAHPGRGPVHAHGEDGRFTADGSLYCRFTGQTLAALPVTGTAAPVTAQTLGLSPLAVPADAPAEIADLATEAFFLDPGNAHAIAAAAGDPPQPDTVVAAQQTLIWNTWWPTPRSTSRPSP